MKLLEKYARLISQGTMTKTDLNALKSRLSRWGMRTQLTDVDKEILKTILINKIEHSGGIKITKEHTLQGINYLKALAFKSNGLPRQTKNQPFGFKEFEVLRTFKYFRLVGLDEVYNGLGEVMSYRFIWEVIGKSGSFKYVQGGGRFDGIEVI